MYDFRHTELGGGAHIRPNFQAQEQGSPVKGRTAAKEIIEAEFGAEIEVAGPAVVESQAYGDLYSFGETG